MNLLSKLGVSSQRLSSVDNGLLVLQSKNFFLWIQCPKISLLLCKYGADLSMVSFSCRQSLHTLLFAANDLIFLTISLLLLKLIFLLFNFQIYSLSVVEVLLCSNLKDNLFKFVFCWSDIRFLVVGSCFCYCCFIYNAFREALAVKRARAFCRQLHSLLS